MVAMGEEWAVGHGISVLSDQRGMWDSGVWRQKRLNTRMEDRQWKVALDDAFTGRNNVIQVHFEGYLLSHVTLVLQWGEW